MSIREPKYRKVEISKINPAPHNARVDLKPKDLEYQQIEASIDKFGLVEPLVWNCRTENLISGHQRLKILIQKGEKEADVSVVDLDLEGEKALCVILNKVQGRWDENKLASLLSEFSEIPNFDMNLIGFTPPEISHLLDQHTEGKEDDFNFEDAVKSIETAITKRGDLIELGPHRILCGDSANPEDLKILMNGKKADILDCDYPYNVNYGGGDKPNPNTRPKKSKKWPQIYADCMPQPEYEVWMKKILVNIKEHLKPGAVFYIWQGLRQIPPLCQSLIDLDFHVSCIVHWLKESAAISYANYSWKTESALYGWLEGAPHYWAGKPGENNVWEVRRDPTKTYSHPTQKPVELGQRALKNSSKINDIVLDTFLGSGSMLIAAESLGRRCYGLEISERFTDGLVLRYINYKGIDKVSKELRTKYMKGVAHG